MFYFTCDRSLSTADKKSRKEWLSHNKVCYVCGKSYSTVQSSRGSFALIRYQEAESLTMLGQWLETGVVRCAAVSCRLGVLGYYWQRASRWWSVVTLSLSSSVTRLTCIWLFGGSLSASQASCSALYLTQSRLVSRLICVNNYVDSAPSLGVYYFCPWLSVCLSVCLSASPSVTLILPIASSFLFLDGIEPFFGHQFSTWHSTKLFRILI